jgi:histidinol-phosphate aminotransferase
MKDDDRLLRLARGDLVAMPGYEPLEAIDVLAARLGMPRDRIVKLDGNENPYGASPRARAVLQHTDSLNEYPDAEQQRLRDAIAEYVGSDPERIVVGNGSDELLDLTGRLFLSPGDRVLHLPPSFGVYEFVAATYAAEVVEVPRREDFSIDLEGAEEALSRGVKLVFLCSPNNPTGNTLPADDLERLLAHDAAFLVDEAYAEFAGESFVPLVARHDNLMVTRTFSKWAGLAGLRVGYGVFPPAIAETLRKIKMPYNVNAAAQAAAIASLEDRETLLESVRLIVEERGRMAERLSGFPWLRVYPSSGNFLLCQVEGRDAKDVQTQLGERGVLVRHFDAPGVRSCLRITAGRPEDTDRLVEALTEIGAASG